MFFHHLLDDIHPCRHCHVVSRGRLAETLVPGSPHVIRSNRRRIKRRTAAKSGL